MDNVITITLKDGQKNITGLSLNQIRHYQNLLHQN